MVSEAQALRRVGEAVGGDLLGLRRHCRRIERAGLVRRAVCASVPGRSHSARAYALQMLGACEAVWPGPTRGTAENSLRRTSWRRSTDVVQTRMLAEFGRIYMEFDQHDYLVCFGEKSASVWPRIIKTKARLGQPRPSVG